MDLLYFLTERLRFIGYFYITSSAAFTELKRKIDTGEEPYVDRSDPEYSDEPAFLYGFFADRLATGLMLRMSVTSTGQLPSCLACGGTQIGGAAGQVQARQLPTIRR